MAVVVKMHNVTGFNRAELPQPIIFCKPDHVTLSGAVSLNVPLAQELASIKPMRRTMRLEQSFRKIIDALPENSVIRDFDVLFNPDYKIDILQIMASVGKSKPFQAIWPGKYVDSQLIYAEEGFRDYKVFETSKYDITIVV